MVPHKMIEPYISQIVKENNDSELNKAYSKIVKLSAEIDSIKKKYKE
jgi:hypothetical protein